MFFLAHGLSADLGGAVGPEIDCVMHWTVVGTTGACCDMRLCIRRRWRGPWTPREPRARPCTGIQNQWKPWIFIGFWWFSLVFIDFHCFSMNFNDFQWFLMILVSYGGRVGDPCDLRGPRDAQTHVTTCPSVPTSAQCITQPISGPTAPPRSLTGRVLKKTHDFLWKSTLKKKQNYMYMNIVILKT